MYCVESCHRVEAVIKKSRFIGMIAPCPCAAERDRILTRLLHDHPSASHIAFAYRIKAADGIAARFYDAGEPSGTAGKPIFQHIEGKKLINVLVAVIRYYGGVKLGAGGLTRAYGNAAKQVIDGSRIIPHIEYREIALRLEYKQMERLEYELRRLNGQVLEQKFSEKVDVTIRLPEDHAERIIVRFPNSEPPE